MEKFVFWLKGPIGNNPELVQIVAWRRIGDKQYLKHADPSTDAIMRH